MPRGDGTGPLGTGPIGGRCLGLGPGRGRGFGGAGSGWRLRYFATGLPGWMRIGEKEALENQARALKSELDLVKKRLEEIGTGDDPE